MISRLLLGFSVLFTVSQGATNLCGSCDIQNVWNDIVLIIDGSISNDIVSTYVQKTLGQMNIGQNATTQSRVGVVVYGQKATVQAKLDVFKSSQDFVNFKINNVQSSIYSMVAGLNAGRALFDASHGHRKHTRMVMVVIAQDVSASELISVYKITELFKSEQGVVVAITPTASSHMSDVANSGYVLQADKDSASDLLQFMCDANCWCPSGYLGWSTMGPRYPPNEGCVYISTGTGTQSFAKKECASRSQGYLAVAKDDNQQEEITARYNVRTMVYIGLEKHISGNNSFWQWGDGTVYDNSGRNTIRGTGTCASLVQPNRFQTEIEAGDCEAAEHYACQTTPSALTLSHFNHSIVELLASVFLSMTSRILLGLAIFVAVCQGEANMCGSCMVQNVWNDIVLVIDGSMSSDLINTYVQKTLGQLNIGQDPKSQSRVGIVVYGQKASVQSKLDTFKSSQEFMNFKINNVQSSVYSMFAGLNAGRALFDQSHGHRRHARMVMVVIAQDVSDNELSSVNQITDLFKSNEGVVITITTKPSPRMTDVATAGYYLQADKHNATELIDFMCDANCWCPYGYVAWSTTEPRFTPNEGCLYISPDTANRALAMKDCDSRSQGYLAVAKDDSQQGYIMNSYYMKTMVYIGLEKHTTEENAFWQWGDGTIYDDSGNNAISGTGNCASLVQPNRFQTQIIAGDCAIAEHYACEATPCSSENNCLRRIYS